MLLTLALTLLAPPAIAAQDSEIYILAGQSNMSGRGAVEELTEAERTPDPRITLFGNDGRWKPAADPVDDPTGQIDAVSADDRAGIGPGLFFARAMPGKVALLPCALGGTAMAKWAPAAGRDTLYGSCVARVRDSGRKPAGVLWYQGESDARTLADSQLWQKRFEAMAARLRADLGQPKLPIVIVQLSDKPVRPDRAASRPGWEVIQQAQQSLSLPCTATVSAKGLKQMSDEIHLATAGQRELGPKLAKAMQGLRAKGCR